MPQLLDDLLIKKDDLAIYRDLSSNSDTGRIDQSIREAQINEMTQFLGGELYLLMLNDYDDVSDSFSNPDYETLWFGEDYEYKNKTQRFNGLKPAITLYAYARMLDTIQLNVTRAGVVTFTEDTVSDPAAQAQIVTKVKSARSEALVYLSRADKYLRAFPDKYPEYKTKDSDIPSKTSLQMFKI